MATEWSTVLPGNWQYGLHPDATGALIRALGRVTLPTGEALRLEMAGAQPGDADVVRVQYYIATEAGGWALWLTCAPADLAAHEAALAAIVPASAGE